MENIIKINNGIGQHKCKVFTPNNEFIGYIHTENEFNDLRVQIKDLSIDGYYLICENYYGEGLDFIFNIDKNGRSTDWDNQFFEHNTDCMSRLL